MYDASEYKAPTLIDLSPVGLSPDDVSEGGCRQEPPSVEGGAAFRLVGEGGVRPTAALFLTLCCSRAD